MGMTKLLIVLMGTSLMACASSPLDTAYEHYKTNINEEHDGALRKENTVISLVTPEYKTWYHEHICGVVGKPTEKERQECDNRLAKNIDEELVRRYPFNDSGKLRETCMANPGACDDPQYVETLARTSHNANVEKSRREKLFELEQWKAARNSENEQEHNRRLASMGQALTNWARATKSSTPPMLSHTCESYMQGGVRISNCH